MDYPPVIADILYAVQSVLKTIPAMHYYRKVQFPRKFQLGFKKLSLSAVRLFVKIFLTPAVCAGRVPVVVYSALPHRNNLTVKNVLFSVRRRSRDTFTEGFHLI